MFKVIYQVLIAGVVNKEPIAPAPRQRIREKNKSFISLIFTIPVYQNIGSTVNTKSPVKQIKKLWGGESKPDSVLTAIYLCPLLGTSVRKVIAYRSEVAAGRIINVSDPLVSVTLKSCQFKICSKFRMWVKSLDTSRV